MIIGNMIKMIRKEMNISQETLARDLNVSYTTLNRWENNKVKPSRLASIQINDYCIRNGISKGIVAELGRLQEIVSSRIVENRKEKERDRTVPHHMK